MNITFTFKLSLFVLVMFLSFGLKAQNNTSKVSKSYAKCLGKSSELRNWKNVQENNVANNKNSTNLKIQILNGKATSIGSGSQNGTNGSMNTNASSTSLNKKYVQKTKLDSIQKLMDVEGVTLNKNSFVSPESTGDIGLNYYIQAVNDINQTRLRVFDKYTGLVVEDVNMEPIWNELNVFPNGDIRIIYDRFVQRWVITEVSFDGLLMAISETSDPLGSYNVYQYATGEFPENPQIGNWKDAYYVTYNGFSNENNSLYVIPKKDIKDGNCEATFLSFDDDVPGISTLINDANVPLCFSGKISPPSNTNFITIRVLDDTWDEVDVDRLEYYEFIPDFENPNNSTVNGPFSINLSSFTTEICEFSDFSCFEEPDDNYIESREGVILSSVQYRNLVDYESILLSFTVAVNDLESDGIRWVELRKEGSNQWSLHQEGTFTVEDEISRFLPAITQDSEGNILLGYSMGGPETFMGVGYTGKFADDPTGSMSFEEKILYEGSSTSESTDWVNFHTMTVDPQNDQNFWLASAYMGEDEELKTGVSSFRMRLENVDAEVLKFVSPVDGDDLSSEEDVTFEIKNTGCENITDVDYTVTLNNEVVESGSFSGLLEPGDVELITLESKIDFSSKGVFDLIAFVSVSEDENSANDSLSFKVKSIPTFDLATCLVDENRLYGCYEDQEFFANYTNAGSELIENFTAELYVDDILTSTVEWTGLLISGKSVDIVFSDVPVLEEENEIRITFSSVNGNDSDQIIENDSQIFTFNNLVDGIKAELKFQSNFQFNDVSWEIVGEDNIVLYSGDNYLQQFASDTVSLCLDEGCYLFNLFDSFGDSWIKGPNTFLEIETENEFKPLVLDTFNFGNVWQKEFCVPVNCDGEIFEIEYEDASNPNAPDAAIYVNFPESTSLTEYSIDGGVTFQKSPLFINLVPGEYTVIIKAQNGCEYSETLTIDVISSLQNLEEITIDISPNPNVGMMKINLSGYDGPQSLKANIVDMNGQLIESKFIHKASDEYRTTLFIESLPSGVYYLSIQDDQIKQMKKFIKI